MDIIDELQLLLIYLVGWEEDSHKEPGGKIFKSWKGYSFEILDKLEESGFIIHTGSTKLLILTDAGKRRAQQIGNKLAHL